MIRINPANLSVRHTAQSYARDLKLSSHYEDYTVPFIEHKFDAFVPDTEAYDDTDFPDPLHPDMVLGRLIVNEFPLHMTNARRDSWFWLFDMCERGTPEFLGNMLDHLEQEETLDLRKNSGTLLHLQVIEVHPVVQRSGIGTALVRYALGLLSRSNFDIAITAAFDDTAPAFDTLFDNELKDLIAKHGPNLPHLTKGHLRPDFVMSFWRKLRFRPWVPTAVTTKRLEKEVMAFGLQLNEQDRTSFALWRPIRSKYRARLARM